MPIFSKEVLTWFTISSVVSITALGIVIGSGIAQPEPKLDIVDYTFKKGHYAADTVFDVTVKNTGGTIIYDIDVVLYGITLKEQPATSLVNKFIGDCTTSCDFYIGGNIRTFSNSDLKPGDTRQFLIAESVIPGSHKNYMKINESYTLQVSGYNTDKSGRKTPSNPADPDVYFTKSITIKRG